MTLKSMYWGVVSQGTWLIQLASVFFRQAPLQTATIILTSLIAQLSLTVAMLLPLKIIILLGGDGVGGVDIRLPFVAGLDRNTLVWVLCFLALGAYLLQAAATYVSDRVSSSGIERILSLQGNLALFENQDQIAANTYRKYASAIQSLIVTVLAALVAAFFYPRAVVAALFFAVLLLVGTGFAVSAYAGLKEALIDNMQGVTARFSHVLFFVVSAFVVVDFLYMQPPGFVPAVVGMILIRQFLFRAAGGVRVLHALHQTRDKINVLFLQERAYPARTPHARYSVWRLLEEDPHLAWLRSVVQEVAGPQVEYKETWRQSGQKEVLFWQVSLLDGRTLLIKLFGQGQRSAAKHEALLLQDPPHGLPAPPLLLTTQVDTLPCHVLDISGLQDLGAEAPLSDEALLESLMPVPPPRSLVRHYVQSQPMLWDEVQDRTFHRLSLVARHSQHEVMQRWQDLTMSLRMLPLTLVIDANRTAAMCRADGALQILHWGAWRLEPLGTSWPQQPEKEADVISAWHAACEERPTLRVDKAQIQLAAAVGRLLKALRQEDYLQALTRLDDVGSRMNPATTDPMSQGKIGKP